VPAFYIRPEGIDDIVMHTVSRVLDLVGVPNDLSVRWNGI
jgi:4-hydroxy-3-polyprenylbenzoate decarboxylase